MIKAILMKIKTISTLLLMSALLFSMQMSFAQKTFNAIDFKIQPNDSNYNNAAAINQLIKRCSQTKGTIHFSKGIYYTSTIQLQSNITIDLDEGAELRAWKDLKAYQHLPIDSTLLQYSSISTDGNNSNSPFDTVWTQALILGINIKNVKLMGLGTINGQHLFNPIGEEHMRGPHTILLSHAANIRLQDILIENAANYAILGYGIKNSAFAHIRIQAGWDGIHIRGGEKIRIQNCDLQTGDDAIAGGYWKDFRVQNSQINSSCNGVRVIMPVNGFTVTNSHFYGPGKFPHRTSGAAHRTNMLIGIYVQPGGWGDAIGEVKNIHFSNLSFQDMEHTFFFELNKGNNANRIQIKNINATQVKHNIAFRTNGDGHFQNVKIENITQQFEAPYVDEKGWAFDGNHINHILLKNITWKVYKQPIQNWDNWNQSTDIKIQNVRTKKILTTREIKKQF